MRLMLMLLLERSDDQRRYVIARCSDWLDSAPFSPEFATATGLRLRSSDIPTVEVDLFPLKRNEGNIARAFGRGGHFYSLSPPQFFFSPCNTDTGLNECPDLGETGAFHSPLCLKRNRQWHLLRPGGSAVPGVLLHRRAFRAHHDDYRDNIRVRHDLPLSQKQDEEAQDTESAGGIRARQLQSQSGQRKAGGPAVHHGETPYGSAEK